MSIRSLAVCLALLIMAPVHADKWAIIIGVDNYQDPGVTDLRYAVKDAHLVHSVLTGAPDGFPKENVILLTDDQNNEMRRPTRNAIIGYLSTWFAEPAADDTVLLYFAGHGVESQGNSFLLPSDARIVNPGLTGIGLETIKESLRQCRARKKLLIVDSCHSGAGRDVAIMGAVTAQSLFQASEGLVTLASCSQQERSYEWDERGHGAFTWFLTEGLRGQADADGDGRITASELNRHVFEETRRWAAGRNLSQHPKAISAVQGDIMLVSVAPRSVPPPQPTPQPQRPPQPQAPTYRMIASHLGNRGPAFERGMTPTALGWGGDGVAYPGRFVVNPIDGAEMVWVPAGSFMMGSTDEQIDALWEATGWDKIWKKPTDEKPAHRVQITEGFWLYRHEVTNGQYARFLEATGHTPHDWWNSYKQHERLPVNNITWDDSVAYARWADGSLPSEAQWEYAARGPSARLFPWGDEWDRTKCCSAEYWAEKPLDYDAWKTWYEGIGANKNEETGGWSLSTSVTAAHMKPVGSFLSGASWCGALDLSGNVWEWCADWYDEGYYGRSPGQNPSGPGGGEKRVLRGGAWDGDAVCCRGADRNYYAPSARGSNVGCRVASSWP